MTSYTNPPEIIVQNYSTTSTTTYPNQLSNYGVSPAVLVPIWISNVDLAKGVFYDYLANQPIYMRYKSKNGWFSLINDPDSIAINNPTAQWIESICQPDSSITPVSGTIASTIKTYGANIVSNTSNIASNTSSINSLSTTVSGNVSSITSLQSTVGTHTSQISALMSSISSLTARLAILESANLNLGSISGSSVPYTVVSGNLPVTQIATNKTNISTLTTNVASLKSVVNANVTTANANSTTYNNETIADASLGANKQNRMSNQTVVTQF